MRSLRAALAFLTRLPGGAHPATDRELAASVPWFPLVGAFVGGVGAAVYVGASELVPASSAAVLAFIVTAGVTGALHEDGLADTVDALAGGATRERRLEILKDSTHGTFGVLALVLVSLLKITALAPLSGWEAVAALVGAHALGRTAAVGLMATAPQARSQGLGADYQRMLSPRFGALGGAVGVVAAVAAFQAWAPLVLLAAAVGTAAVGGWAYRRIGGVTGDVLGAAEQVTEALVLLTATWLFL